MSTEASRSVFTMRTKCGDPFLSAVDDWRRRQPAIPSRSEAVRRLVEIGLNAESIESRETGGQSPHN